MQQMIGPAGMLVIGSALVAVLVWVLWPKRGLLAILQRARLNTERVRLEDALKFLFDCEYKNIPCGLNSIAGNLNISTDKATRIMDRLSTMGLVSLNHQVFELTDSGRSYALRIIRVHRIWERYLADETGIDQIEWHGEADRREHNISAEVADRLAAQMGNPVFDPHGDPIPSARGELPEHRGQTLSSLQEGDIAMVLHIEDEPHTIYEQLVALGLYPGMQIYVLDAAQKKITFAANGAECSLTSLFANSITVELTPEKTPLPKQYDLLSSAEVGEKVRVLAISPACRGQQRRRLMDLGIVPGSIISAEIRSASGDPVGYRIKGATIAIRRNQADLIFVSRNIDELHEQPA
ncbi:MAG: metal-dependent transcriptional regulator [Bacteroidota bacterium]